MKEKKLRLFKQKRRRTKRKIYGKHFDWSKMKPITSKNTYTKYGYER